MNERIVWIQKREVNGSFAWIDKYWEEKININFTPKKCQIVSISLFDQFQAPLENGLLVRSNLSNSDNQILYLLPDNLSTQCQNLLEFEIKQWSGMVSFNVSKLDENDLRASCVFIICLKFIG
jgi:hypothetical protein